MKLSKSIAQKIVTEMMSVIPYNINVMDENGIIIGSGDSNRIGTKHLGAIKAISEAHSNEVFQFGEGMKPGVNEPIIIGDKVVGVVGITGEPEEVRPFGRLVRVTAVLLIEQGKINEREQDARLNKEKFYHELSQRKDVYDEEFIQRASNYGIDLTKSWVAIVVDGEINSPEFLKIYNKYNNVSYLENNKVVFYVADKYIYKNLVFELERSKAVKNVGIGDKNPIFSYSLENAMVAIEFGVKIRPCIKIHKYDDLKFFIHISYDNRSELSGIIASLHKSGNKLELIRTIQVYIHENGDINKIASRLNIHRNTLNYRLDRVQELTGKNPKVLTELFELMCGILWY